MNENARLNVSVGIYVAVSFTACDTSIYKFSVILEVYCKELFAAFQASYVSYLMIHILTLFRTE